MTQRFPILQELGERIEHTALTAETQSGGASRVVASLSGLAGWLHGRPTRLRALLGAGGGVLVAAAVVVVVLLVSGSAATSASWAAVPRPAGSSALSTALRKCYKITETSNALGKPVLSESRGETTAAVYVADGTVSLCRYNASVGDVNTESMGSVRAAPAPDLLSTPYVDQGGSGYGHLPHKLLEEIKRAHGHLTRAENIARVYALEDGGYGFWALGRAGSRVSRVAFAFANKKTVLATVENGWYFAWWPWTTDPTSATVTTTNGITTSPMRNAFPNHAPGSKPAAACRLGSAGCIFAKATNAPRTTTTTTPARSPIAKATRTCDKFSLNSGVTPANVFASKPVLTDTHGIFAALFSTANGKLYGCLIGGNQANVHAFFVEDLRSLGKVGSSPGATKLTAPYDGQNGEGEGRPYGLEMHNARSQAQRLARREKFSGGGYGPYVIGQAGSKVTAVEITFANGKSVDAALKNGWYFAWWPWISTPTSITVHSAPATTTSRLKESPNPNRSPFETGCTPGSANCVFAK